MTETRTGIVMIIPTYFVINMFICVYDCVYIQTATHKYTSMHSFIAVYFIVLHRCYIFLQIEVKTLPTR